jgi:membrane protein YdbS with pleckstrin-like domain
MKNRYISSLLGENERILLVSRQHWFVLFTSIFAEILVIVIILAIFTAALLYSPFAALGYILLIFPIGSMVLDILKWSNRMYIVSNRRVIQVNGIINKNVIDSSLEKVNDVKMTQSFFGRIFDYGDVEILTASELGVNLFRRIVDPVHFKTAMLNAKEGIGFHENGVNRPAQPLDVPTMIAKLDDLRKQGILTDEEFQEKKTKLLANI